MSNNRESRSIKLIKKINSIPSQIKRIKIIIESNQLEIGTINSKLKNLNNKLKNLNNNIRNENTISSFVIKNSDSKKMYQQDKKQLEEDLKSLNKNIVVYQSMIESLVKIKYDLIQELYESNITYYKKYVSLSGHENNTNYYEKLKMKVLNNKIKFYFYNNKKKSTPPN